MAQCPVDEMCDPVREHHNSLYGDNGVKNQITQLRIHMTGLVTRRAVWATFLSCLMLIMIIGGLILDVWATTKETNRILPKIEKKVESHESRITSTETEVKHFQKEQSTQTVLLRQIADKLDIEKEGD